MRRLCDMGLLRTMKLAEFSATTVQSTIAPRLQEGGTPRATRAKGREEEEKNRVEERGTRARSAASENGHLKHPIPPSPQNNTPEQNTLEMFRLSFHGPWHSGTETAFRKHVTADSESALLTNTPLWMQTKRYGDGFVNSAEFIRSEVWRHPPQKKPARKNNIDETVKRILGDKR